MAGWGTFLISRHLTAGVALDSRYFKMRSILLWMPAAVITFLLASVATTLLLRPTNLSNCVIELSTVEKPAAADDPSSEEVAQIYAVVLGEKGFVGFLRTVKGYEWTFEVFD